MQLFRQVVSIFLQFAGKRPVLLRKAPGHLVVLLLTVILAGCQSEIDEKAPEDVTSMPQTLEWDDLMPAGYDPASVMPDVDISEIDDSDPRAEEYQRQLREAWDQAPVVTDLNGKTVRIPGFIVPVEYDDKSISEFLLVPYFGACIHVPPPPANQIVHASGDPFAIDPQALWDPVWVSGRLSTEHVSSELAEAGYSLAVSDIEPYDIDVEQ